ncbi:thioredoxin family protein [Thermomicrobium sp. 4228-Ro]|uniref:thioredoxin family protein n=1 Tax=Thermomicrobium sp. 4228-Ro TaxID=2993937 RepID=UPI0022499A96|nr:thioredoxin family protein [Thermomicrobium sp. 4228-Ro]MCX2726772.1 thioredoxin family protein [Thermomicrobium sp. 4228-Ro]
MTRLRLFTHPICHGCTEAVAVIQQLASEEPSLVVEVVSLATPAGRAAAQEAGVVVVPTVVIDGERIEGVPDLEELRARLRATSRTGGRP